MLKKTKYKAVSLQELQIGKKGVKRWTRKSKEKPEATMHSWSSNMQNLSF